MMPEPPAFDLQKRPEAGLAWFEMRDVFGHHRHLVTTEHDSRHYVVLSTKSDQVMLGGRDTPPGWRLLSAKLTGALHGGPTIELVLDDAGGKRLADLLRRHGGSLAVLINDRVVMAEMITSISVAGNKFEFPIGYIDMPKVEAIRDALATAIQSAPRENQPAKRSRPKMEPSRRLRNRPLPSARLLRPQAQGKTGKVRWLQTHFGQARLLRPQAQVKTRKPSRAPGRW